MLNSWPRRGQCGSSTLPSSPALPRTGRRVFQSCPRVDRMTLFTSPDPRDSIHSRRRIQVWCNDCPFISRSVLKLRKTLGLGSRGKIVRHTPKFSLSLPTLVLLRCWGFVIRLFATCGTHPILPFQGMIKVLPILHSANEVNGRMNMVVSVIEQTKNAQNVPQV